MEFFFYHGDVSRNVYIVTNNEFITYECRYERKKFTKYLYDNNNKLFASLRFNVTKKWVPEVLQPCVLRLEESNEEILVHFKSFPFTYVWFNYNNNIFKAIFHIGRKISLFKNEIQIGYYITDTEFNGSRGMKLVINKHESLHLLLMFCFRLYSDFWDEGSGGDNPAFNLVLPLKRFNKRWRPIDT
jgi:hypothetical protein